jgi:DNA-binding NarL/FixJ family response regulator
MAGPIKVLLVDDDWSVREALRQYLSRHGIIVCEADCAETAVAVSVAEQPGVVVMDIVLPEQPGQRADFDQHTGIDAAQRLCELLPGLGIVFLSAYVDRGNEVVRLFTTGHDRIVYLLKGSRPQELLDAIHTVARKQPVLNLVGVRPTRTTAFDLACDTLTDEEKSCVTEALARFESLTEPERRVFEAIGGCRTHKQVAENLKLSAKTVSYHMDAIYEKLGLREVGLGLNQLMVLAKVYLLYQLQQTESSKK